MAHSCYLRGIWRLALRRFKRQVYLQRLGLRFEVTGTPRPQQQTGNED
ncbi:MAG: hypothetical protein AAF243_07955 [Cyanobacteria bacterium P01_A01_bin.137]